MLERFVVSLFIKKYISQINHIVIFVLVGHLLLHLINDGSYPLLCISVTLFILECHLVVRFGIEVFVLFIEIVCAGDGLIIGCNRLGICRNKKDRQHQNENDANNVDGLFVVLMKHCVLYNLDLND